MKTAYYELENEQGEIAYLEVVGKNPKLIQRFVREKYLKKITRRKFGEGTLERDLKDIKRAPYSCPSGFNHDD